MRRRDFTILASGAAVAWPLVTQAEQIAKMPTIGILGSDASAWGPWVTAFAERLGTLGWVDKRGARRRSSTKAGGVLQVATRWPTPSSQR
jgi:hypothetical protein